MIHVTLKRFCIKKKTANVVFFFLRYSFDVCLLVFSAPCPFLYKLCNLMPTCGVGSGDPCERGNATPVRFWLRSRHEWYARVRKDGNARSVASTLVVPNVVSQNPFFLGKLGKPLDKSLFFP